MPKTTPQQLQQPRLQQIQSKKMLSTQSSSTLWIFLSIFSVLSLWYSILFFPEAFPTFNLNITTTKEDAYIHAKNLIAPLSLQPNTSYMQAASFEGDDETQMFLELEFKNDALAKVIKYEPYYHLYCWKVRIFKENEISEASIQVSPTGKILGFNQDISETETGTNVANQDARTIVERIVTKAPWFLSLESFKLVESKEDTKIGGRLDHTFVYERVNPSVGSEIKFRLSLTIAGDRLVKLKHHVHIPEAFQIRYEEMRSSNNLIASICSSIMFVLYFGIGCIVMLFFLIRWRYIIWKHAIYCGVTIGMFLAGTLVNEFPLKWMNYDTAVSISTFQLTYAYKFVLVSVLACGGFTLIFAVSESIVRLEFPYHIQLGMVWSRPVSSSLSILGRTVTGYLFVPIMSAYEIFFYSFTRKYLGWWVPASSLFNPNILSHRLPWLSPFALALQAGTWEECIFRAVPLSLALLVGKKCSGKLSKCLFWFAFILQAIIFGGAHASYPTQPSYGRVVELIIPSFTFALLFIKYGLLVSMIFHFAYDVVWMSMPLFMATGTYWSRIIIIFISLIPLWIVLISRFLSPKWFILDKKFYNLSFSPPTTPAIMKKKTTSKKQESFLWKRPLLAMLFGLVGFTSLIYIGMHNNLDASDLMISKEEAQIRCKSFLQAQNYSLDWNSWEIVMNVVNEPTDSDRFCWDITGANGYNALLARDGNLIPFLSGPHWSVRVLRFEGKGNVSAEDRAEEIKMKLTGNGTVFSFHHKWPESWSGQNLSEIDANHIANDFLLDFPLLTLYDVTTVSAVLSKPPSRTDWEFVFKLVEKNQSLQIESLHSHDSEQRMELKISSDKMVGWSTQVHLPEQWKRDKKVFDTKMKLLKNICNGLIILSSVIAAGIAIQTWASSQPNYPFPSKFVLITFIVVALLKLIRNANKWSQIIFQFTTSEPYNHQIVQVVLGYLLGTLLTSIMTALLFGLFFHITSSRMFFPVGLRQLAILSCYTALTIVGFDHIYRHLYPNRLLHPKWAKYNHFPCFLPFLERVLSTFFKFISSCQRQMVLWCILEKCKSHKTRFLGILIFSLLIQGIGTHDGLLAWLGAVIYHDLIMILLYSAVLFSHPEVIPLLCAACLVLDEIISNSSSSSLYIYFLIPSICIMFLSIPLTRIFQANVLADAVQDKKNT